MVIPQPAEYWDDVIFCDETKMIDDLECGANIIKIIKKCNIFLTVQLKVVYYDWGLHLCKYNNNILIFERVIWKAEPINLGLSEKTNRTTQNIRQK